MAEIVDQVEQYDLTIWQGKSWSLECTAVESDKVTVIPVDGYSGRGQVREYAGGPLCADITVEVDPAGQFFTLSLSPEQTRKIKNHSMYDVELVSGSHVVGVLHGEIEVIPEVTIP